MTWYRRLAWLFYPRILVLGMGRFQAVVALLAWVLHAPAGEAQAIHGRARGGETDHGRGATDLLYPVLRSRTPARQPSTPTPGVHLVVGACAALEERRKEDEDGGYIRLYVPRCMVYNIASIKFKMLQAGSESRGPYTRTCYIMCTCSRQCTCMHVCIASIARLYIHE